MQTTTVDRTDKGLPSWCYYAGPDDTDGEVFVLRTGSPDVWLTDDQPDWENIDAWQPRYRTRFARQHALTLNAGLGITPAEFLAMEAGLKLGWDSPAADPRVFTGAAA